VVKLRLTSGKHLFPVSLLAQELHVNLSCSRDNFQRLLG
jgi:hypothetical protein